MKKLSLKEVYLREQEGGGSEFGEDPILTDYTSLKDVTQAMKQRVIEALKAGDHEGVSAAIKEAVRQGARYGHVAGWDKAWTEAEREFEGHREDDGKSLDSMYSSD